MCLRAGLDLSRDRIFAFKRRPAYSLLRFTLLPPGGLVPLLLLARQLFLALHVGLISHGDYLNTYQRQQVAFGVGIRKAAASDFFLLSGLWLPSYCLRTKGGRSENVKGRTDLTPFTLSSTECDYQRFRPPPPPLRSPPKLERFS